MHTNSVTIKHDGRMHYLDTMNEGQLDILRTSLMFNISDIQSQLNRSKGGFDWQERARVVVGIKEKDILKIDNIIGQRQEPVSFESFDLRSVLIEAMEDFIPDETIEKIIGRVMSRIAQAEKL